MSWDPRALSSRFLRVTLHGRYRPEIDGLRFIAIAFVLIGHLIERTERAVALRHPLTSAEEWLSFLVPKATTGVLLFFTISGYILGLQFLRQEEKGQRFDYRSYLFRRASRIAPPYYLVLLLGFLALTIGGYHPELMKMGQTGLPLERSVLVSLLFVHGIVFGMLPQAFPPGWSLEVEIQFYIVAPLLFMLMMRGQGAGRSGQRTQWMKWLVFGASFAAMAACTILLGKVPGYYLSLARFLPFFILGPLLLLLVGRSDGDQPASRSSDIVGFAALALLAASGIVQNVAEGWLPVTMLDAVRLVAISGMFIGAVRGRAFRAMCSLRWVCILGGACFSLYLCHLQVMQVMTPLVMRLIPTDGLATSYAVACVVQLPVVVAVSMVFYLLVERPFMKGFGPASRGADQPVAGVR